MKTQSETLLVKWIKDAKTRFLLSEVRSIFSGRVVNSNSLISLLLIALIVLEPLTALSVTRVKAIASQPQASPVEVAVVRHAPVVNGHVEGSVRQLTGESVVLNSSGFISGDLLVPGTPTLTLNGTPSFGGVVNGTGSPNPTNYQVVLNSGSTLGHLVRRTNPITLADVSAPPASSGTRSVTLNSPGQSPGDFATLRDLTLNGNVGLITVPAGTYRNFTANAGGFVMGVAGASQPSVYNLSRLILNSNTQLQIVGPVLLTLGNALTVNAATVGASANPNWLTIKIASGGLTLNSGSALYGLVRAPYGSVVLNAPVQGSIHCDRLTINSSGQLTGVSVAQGVLDSVTPVRAVQGQSLAVTLSGHDTHWLAGQTTASFGGEVSVGGAAPGEPGPVTVVNETTAVADLVVSATAALSPRPVRVVTPLSGGGTEDLSLTDGFTVGAVTPPGAATTNVTTIAGSSDAGFADGPAAQARFRSLAGLAIGQDESIYIADSGNHRIRVVREQSDGSRLVETVAGSGTAGFQDGAAAQARFNNPQGVAIAADGTVYVADTANNRIRRIATGGTVSTLAGDGVADYRNGPGIQARFNGPRGVALDQQGNLYVADTGNSAVRLVTPAGDVQTVAGDGTVGSNDSPNAHFNGLQGVATDGSTVLVYLSDSGNHRIRRLDPTGTVITLSGADRGFADGDASVARFAGPGGLALDGSGRIVVADTINSLIRVVTSDLVINGSLGAAVTVAGTGERGLLNGAGNVATFTAPQGVAISLSSAIIVADTGNNVVRRIGIPPVITSLSPTSARVNTSITIFGESFDGRGPDRNTVKFTRAGGGQTTAVVSAATRTQLTVMVPNDAATGTVTVTTADGTATSPTPFSVEENPAPRITDFTPRRGQVGTTVKLIGTALKSPTGEPSVTFAGPDGTRLPALVSSATETEVQVMVPNGAITGRIVLNTDFGQAVTDADFIVDDTLDFQITAAPSAATAVQGGQATFMVYVTSPQTSFTQLARLSVSNVPTGARVAFDPAQITAGDKSTFTVNLASASLSAGSYSMTLKADADIDGHEVSRTANITLNIIAGGQTTLSGRVLSTDGDPIMGATASLDGRTATTDAAGTFLLTGVSGGVERPLMVDGRTASAPNRTYPIIIEPATIIDFEANEIPYNFYLPPIDTQYEVDLVPGQITNVSNPRVDDVLMTIPAGANLRNRDGSPVTRVSITPVPIDRTPAPLPSDVATAMVYTSQPGGAITDVPIPVVYPNLSGIEPGTQVPLYAFNHDSVQWYVYGYGRVTPDGRTIVPEIDPNTGSPYGLPDFSWHFPGAGPGGNPGGGNDGDDGDGDDGKKKKKKCDDSNTGGNPVDYSTGIKIEKATDIEFGGARGGITFTRTYTSDLAQFCDFCPFGRGTTHNYAIRVTGNFVNGGSGRVVMPAEGTGRLFNYTRTDPDGALVFTTRETVAQLGVVLRRLTNGTFEYRLPNGDKKIFDSSGQMTAVIDHNGNVTTLAYSGQGLTSITDAVGRSVSFAYDGSGRIVTATDPLGRSWHYTYEGTPGVAGNPGLTTIKDPLNHITRWEYVTGGRLSKIIDPRGISVKRVTYDGNGRVIQQRFADGGIEKYAYSLSGTVVTGVTITDPLGRVSTKRFNATGYVLSSKDELGQAVQYDRNINNNLPTSSSGTCGCTEVSRQYDASGNVLSATDRNGTTIQMEYDSNNNQVTKYKDSFGNTTTVIYDSRGNATSITNALNQTTSSVFDSFGQLTSVTDPLNHTTRMEYDSRGNVIAVIDPLNRRQTMEYDLLGRRTAIIDPVGRRESVTYDALDRVLTSTDTANAVTHYDYDNNGNLTKVTDAINRIWTATFDQQNRPLTETDPLGRIQSLSFNVGGQVTAVTSTQGRVVSYTYNERDQVLTKTDTGGGVSRYAYDTKGNLVSIRDKRGNITTYSYDAVSRPLSRRNSLGQNTSVSYDAMGQITEAIDQRGHRRTFDYDALGRTLKAIFEDAQITYTYDNNNRVTSISDTQSGDVSWTYDDTGQTLSETTPSGTVQYTYDSAGKLASMTAADRPPVTYGYDSAGRLQTITQGVDQFSYSYDTLSRTSSLSRPNAVTTSYTYDSISRLERLQHVNGASQPIEDYQYNYTLDDQIASITSLASATQQGTEKTGGTADTANRLLHLGNVSYGFNDKGQLTSKTDAQGTTQYKWDSRGRLVMATLPNGDSASYGYDALGRLRTRSTGGATTSYLYDGVDVVQDQNSDGTKVDYVNGQGFDQKLRQSSDATGSIYFLQDHLSSTTALTNESGAVVEREQYDAFGAGSASSLTRYGYTGRERDGLTGLYHYRARWYDPDQGRFISQDPIGLAGGMNYYGYAGNDPINFNDPSGLSFATFMEGLLAGGVTGFLMGLAVGAIFAAIEAATAGTAAAVIVPILAAILGAEAALSIANEIVALITEDMCPDERHYRIGYLIGSIVGAIAGAAVSAKAGSPPGSDTLRGGDKLPDERISAPPKNRGDAPKGDDGHPVELHHRGQVPDGPLDEMTRTDHRLGDNYKKNHPNTGQDRSLIDRKVADRERVEHWEREWDSGRFKPRQ